MDELPMAFLPLEETDVLLIENESESGSSPDAPLLLEVTEEERVLIEQMRVEADAFAVDPAPPAPPAPFAAPKPSLRERSEPILRRWRTLKGNSVDLAINALTVLGVLAALACLVFLVIAGTAAYGRHPLLAGLDVWFAVLSAGVTYVSLRVAFALQRMAVRRNAPAIHANDLPHRRSFS